MGASAPGRVRIGAWLSFLVLTAAIAPLDARGQAGNADELSARRAAAGKAAARRLVDFGAWCKGRGYPALAREQFEGAIRLDPDEPVARAALGYRRDEKGWSDPGVREALQDLPVLSPLVAAVLDRESEAAYAAGAAAFADLAAWCTSAGLEKEAREAWWEVLGFDPGHRGARAALDLSRADAAWTEPGEGGPGEFDRRLRRAAEEAVREVKAALAKEPTAVVTEAGKDGAESREARFLVRTTLKEAPSALILEDLLQAEALWRGLGVVEPRTGAEPPFHFDATDDEEGYLARLKTWPGMDEADRVRHSKSGGCWADDDSFLVFGDARRIRESAVHYATHHMFHHVAPAPPPHWIYEGAAVLSTMLLRRTADCHCVAIGESSAENRDLGKADWNIEIRERIRKGEDTPIQELLAAKANDMGVTSLLKARSMAAWLVLKSPAGFRAVLAESRKKLDPALELRAALGAPPEAVERRWRQWARRP